MIKMKRPSNAAILFNGAAILIAGASMAVVLRSVLFANDLPPCTERYLSSTRLTLDRNGQALVPADLPSRFNNTDWGPLTESRVVKLRTGPATHALEVDLALANSVNAPANSAERPGIGFKWAPDGIEDYRAACLSYAIYLPQGFAFGSGGRLPGLTGTSPDIKAGDTSTANSGEAAPAASPQSFSSRYRWSTDGKADIYAQLPGLAEGRSLDNERRGFVLPTGRWSRLEQEVVLNTPGKRDGALRVWQDGELVFQNTTISFRITPKVTFTGVLAEMIGGDHAGAKTIGSQKLWLTPFELRWQ